jgi:hypothetical protein
MVKLLQLVEAPVRELGPALALAAEWRRETGAEGQWCWPSQLEVPALLDAAPLRKMPVDAMPGAALWLALCEVLAAGQVPLLVRAGYPGIDLAQLRQAKNLLAQGDAVFGVVAGADYALVGLGRAVPELFAGIPWGTNRVMAVTRAQARRYGCRIGEVALG